MNSERHCRRTVPANRRNDSRGRRARQCGLTLVELMIGMAVSALVFGFAVPNFQEFVARTRLGSGMQEFVASVRLARSEAIRRSGQVALRRSAGAESGNWGKGWTMFADANGNGVLDSGEQVIRDGVPLPEPMTLVASANLAEVIAFNRDGQLTGAGGVFVLCHGPSLTAAGQPRSRAALINGAGQVRMASDLDNDGVPEKDDAPVSSCTSP